MPESEILHISYRPPKHNDTEYKYLYTNVVIRVYDEHDIAVCDGYSDSYTRGTLYEVEDIEQIHNHHLHTKHKFVPITQDDGTPHPLGLSELVSIHTDPKYDISDKIRKGWTYNHYGFLQKAKLPGVYYYCDYIEDNAVTRATLATLEDLKNGGENTSRFVTFSTISRCILTLHIFWD